MGQNKAHNSSFNHVVHTCVCIINPNRCSPLLVGFTRTHEPTHPAHSKFSHALDHHRFTNHTHSGAPALFHSAVEAMCTAVLLYDSNYEIMTFKDQPTRVGPPIGKTAPFCGQPRSAGMHSSCAHIFSHQSGLSAPC